MHRNLMAAGLAATALLAATAAFAGPATTYTPPLSASKTYRLACTVSPAGVATIKNTLAIAIPRGKAIHVIFRFGKHDPSQSRPQSVPVGYAGLPVGGTLTAAQPKGAASCIATVTNPRRLTSR